MVYYKFVVCLKGRWRRGESGNPRVAYKGKESVIDKASLADGQSFQQAISHKYCCIDSLCEEHYESRNEKVNIIKILSMNLGLI